MIRLRVFVLLAVLCLALAPHPGTAAQSTAETEEIAAIEKQVLAAQDTAPVAMVNGQPIPRWMYDNALRDRLARLPAAERDKAEVLARERQTILDNLLQMELLAQEAARQGVEADIGAGYIRAGIMAKAHGNDLLFAKALAKAGMTRQQYVEIWKQQVSVNRWVQEVLQPTLAVTEEAMRARYARDLPELNIPRRIRVQEVFAPWTSENMEGRRDLETLTPLLVNATHALSRSEDFLAGARAMASGALAPVRGLAIGEKGLMPLDGNATLAKAGAERWQAGDTVGPFPSSGGLHVWRVLEIQAARQASFEDVREALQTQMFEEATHEAIAARSKTLREGADVKILLP
ncbi:peptidylprolyl isomerase [Megalodesulfovibrio paquesii]